MRRPTYEVVGKIERYDERDNVFAREALEPGSPEEIDYHRRNPRLIEIDREIGSFIKGKRDKSASGWKKAYYQGAFSPIAHLGLPDCVDGVPLSPRIGRSPVENSRVIKALALHLGADLVGIGPLKQEWVYSHRGVLPYFSAQEANPPLFDGMPEHYTGREYGDAIVLEHPEAIAMAFAQAFDVMKAGPGEASDLEVGRVYSRSALVASQLARFIRTLGYSARAHHLRNYGVLVVPVAVDAGLGELARCGYMVSRKYGANTRISCVTTDMPLRHDEPAEIGIQDFCNKCLKCARTCPAKAIPDGDKVEVNGTLRYKADAEKCLLYWGKVGAACMICQTICPWSKPPTAFHRTVAWTAVNLPWSRRVLVTLDDVFYGRKFVQKPKPQWVP
jgi:reductive dehalogenase